LARQSLQALLPALLPASRVLPAVLQVVVLQVAVLQAVELVVGRQWL